MRLDGKVVLITGGSSGIGLAAAKSFSLEGARVVIADVRDAEGDAAIEEIKENGGDVVYVHTDVTQPGEIEGAVRVAEDTFGGLNVVVANAGIAVGLGKRLEDLTEETWFQTIDVNVAGVFRSFKYSIPALRRAGGGVLLATGSIAAVTGMAGNSVYSASKGAIVSLVRSLAFELAPDHIRVNSVCPGTIDTNLVQHSLPDYAALAASWADSAPAVGRLRDDPGQLVRRVGDPLEVARIFLFLASDDASLITGQALVADAGWTSAGGWMVAPA